jgi:adenylate cyclase
MIFFQTLGTLDLRSEATQVRSVLTQPKRLALLAYLAVAEPRGFHARERILGLFWPESDQERARNALRQSLHYLRRSLGDGVIVSRGDHEVAIAPDAFRCDAVAFDEALAGDRPAEALDLYQGEFLAGLFVDDAPGVEQWIEDQRMRYRRAAVQAARAAAAAEETRGGQSAAILLMRRALAIDPHDDDVLADLLLLHERAGNRTGAIQDFEAFRKRLDADLGLEPSAATRTIVERIGAADGVRPDQAAPAPPVAQPAEAVRPRPPESPPALKRTRRAFGWASWAIGGLALTGLAAVLAVLLDPWSGPAPTATLPAGPPAVAVLPFANMSGDPTREFLSDGMAEELMTALARVPELRIVARTSAFSFKGRQVGVDSIARALRATHVVEGSVRTSGPQIRVTAQLVDAESGYQLWGGTFEAGAADIFHVQDSIARAIVAALEPSLGIQAATPFERPTSDPEAHADFLRGLAARGRDTPEGMAQAEQYFLRAVARDSTYARPWAGLAEIRSVDAYRRVIPEEAGYDEAKTFAERALALDPSLASPHVVLGRIAGEHDWDFATAEHHYRRALELEPGNVIPMRGLARLLSHLGRSDEALELSRRSLELDPVSPVAHRWLGSAYMLAGEHERAVEILESVVALDLGNSLASISLAMSLSALGRDDEAVEAAARALNEAPDEQLFVSHAAVVQADAGNTARARELLARLEASPRPAFYYRAMILGALGDADAAFEALDRAIEDRESVLIQIGVMPSFDRLRGDARFDEVLRRVGLRR